MYIPQQLLSSFHLEKAKLSSVPDHPIIVDQSKKALPQTPILTALFFHPYTRNRISWHFFACAQDLLPCTEMAFSPLHWFFYMLVHALGNEKVKKYSLFFVGGFCSRWHSGIRMAIIFNCRRGGGERGKKWGIIIVVIDMRDFFWNMFLWVNIIDFCME